MLSLSYFANIDYIRKTLLFCEETYILRPTVSCSWFLTIVYRRIMRGMDITLCNLRPCYSTFFIPQISGLLVLGKFSRQIDGRFIFPIVPLFPTIASSFTLYFPPFLKWVRSYDPESDMYRGLRPKAPTPIKRSKCKLRFQTDIT